MIFPFRRQVIGQTPSRVHFHQFKLVLPVNEEAYAECECHLRLGLEAALAVIEAEAGVGSGQRVPAVRR